MDVFCVSFFSYISFGYLQSLSCALYKQNIGLVGTSLSCVSGFSFGIAIY